MAVIRQFIRRIKSTGTPRCGTVKTMSMGHEHVFEAYDVGNDTYVFEKGIQAHLSGCSVLVAAKSAVRKNARGMVMTLSTGNHAVAAFPLLDGRFWKMSNLPSDRRGDVLRHVILCANVVGETIEISQREVPTDILVACDRWLLDTAGFSMQEIVMVERNDITLNHYRCLGQEWRIKPLAWTEKEMRVALDASRRRISSSLRYYHSAIGVHFLAMPAFRDFARLAETDTDAFLKCLGELVRVYEGNETSFTRMPKYRGHHEVELFGLRRGDALQWVIPELEDLLQSIDAGRIGQLGVIQKIQEIMGLYESLLINPDLADETSQAFVETMYMSITGEVYSVVGDGTAPAFDDRRTALPGATFVDGRQVAHPGADSRTEILLSNLRGLMSKDEVIEYANVYELRAYDDSRGVQLGRGTTREVVYKTNRRPLENSLVEKRLSHSSRGYSSYILARIGALRSLGVALSDFYIMLKRRPGAGKGSYDHYIRRRCEGEPMEAIPARYFRSVTDASGEDREVVLALASLMGDAAAQNMAMKKYSPKFNDPLYGIGKEIYEFEYDIIRGRAMPKRVSTCSIRGSFGWPSLDYTDENFDAIAEFYLGHFATALLAYQTRHPEVAAQEIVDRFLDGFEYRTRSMAWRLSVMRDRFEAFSPEIPSRYGFDKKWKFVMWALVRQESAMAELRGRFAAKFAADGRK